MRKTALLWGIWLGGLTSLPVMALLFLGNQLAGLPFVPFDIIAFHKTGCSPAFN